MQMNTQKMRADPGDPHALLKEKYMFLVFLTERLLKRIAQQFHFISEHFIQR